MALPLRVYLAAECESLIETTVEDFLWNCFEAMDRPDARFDLDLQKMPEVYTDEFYQVKVYPKKYFYGATNSLDGVYEVDGKYYTIDCVDDIIQHDSLKDAIDCIAEDHWLHCSRYGVEYQPILE